jgi:thiamine biosynthesis protein ThiI
MENIILIRIGEIFLKGSNKRFFENRLLNNIKKSLYRIKCKIVKAHNRCFIENFQSSDQEEIVYRLKKVFGIHSISPAIKIPTDFEGIKQAALSISPTQGFFRVTVNRADKRIVKRSMDIAAEIGAFILKQKPNLKVNLFEYDFEINVDIREEGFSYIFCEKIAGQGGLPVGCSGKGMLLLSGGIDSPVAGYKIAKRGVELFAVHFYSYPYTSENAKEKVIDLAKKLSEYAGEITLFVVPFTEIQYQIKEKCPISYLIAIMRRFMVRIAEKLAEKNGCGAIITGESLGQVASQTMESINSTNSVIKMPVFRPLIGYDKIEIIDIAKNIGTYDLSILPFEDCCTVFTPQDPVIRPKLEEVQKIESVLDVNKLVDDAVNGVETIVCRS